MTAKKPSESQGAPLEHVGTDLFEYAGKHYLVVVDRLSGYPLVKQLQKTDTGAVTGWHEIKWNFKKNDCNFCIFESLVLQLVSKFVKFYDA